MLKIKSERSIQTYLPSEPDPSFLSSPFYCDFFHSSFVHFTAVGNGLTPLGAFQRFATFFCTLGCVPLNLNLIFAMRCFVAASE